MESIWFPPLPDWELLVEPDAKAAIWGMTLNAGKAHVLRAGLESIAYQVKDLIDMMTRQAGIELKALRVDGGPTKNQFLMQFQADMLHASLTVRR